MVVIEGFLSILIALEANEPKVQWLLGHRVLLNVHVDELAELFKFGAKLVIREVLVREILDVQIR